MVISVSLMSAELLELRTQLGELEKTKDVWAHIDMMDGYFAPNIGFSKMLVQKIKENTNLFTDVHLMVRDPMEYAKILSECSVDLITFHADSYCDRNKNEELIRYLHEKGIKAGISLRRSGEWELLLPHLEQVDLILVIGTDLGYGGQGFDMRGIEKIRWLDEYRKEKGLTYFIEVDGGVNGEIGKICCDNGANVLVSGSFLFRNGEICKNIATLRRSVHNE